MHTTLGSVEMALYVRKTNNTTINNITKKVWYYYHITKEQTIVLYFQYKTTYTPHPKKQQ